MDIEPPMAPATPTPARKTAAFLRVVMAYAAFSALWILLSDRLVVVLARNAEQAVLMNTLKGWLFVGVTSLLLYRMMQGQLNKARKDVEPKEASRWPVRPVLLLSAGVVVLTVLGIREVYRRQWLREEAQLRVVADFKAHQIGAWVRERQGDAEFTASSAVWSRAFDAWQYHGDLAEREHLLTRLESFRHDKGYRLAQVLQADGSLVASMPFAAPVDAELRGAVREAAETGKVRFVGPYRDALGIARLDFLAPLRGLGGRPGSVVALTCDPKDYLTPLLQNWPAPSPSGEGVLYRIEDGVAVFLSESKVRPGEELRLRIPVDAPDSITGRQARDPQASGRLVKGLDYRGQRVAAVTAAVPGTSWLLLAKVDQAELDAAIQGQVTFIGLAGLLGVFLIALAHHLIRQQRIMARSDQERILQEERLRALRLLDGIASGSSDAIYAKDRDGRYLMLNPEAERVLGRRAVDLIGRDDRSLPGSQGEAGVEVEAGLLREGGTRTLEEVRGGRTFLVTKGALRDAQGAILGLYCIAKDITERKRRERNDEARNRLLERVASGEPLQDLLDALARTVEELSPGCMAGVLLHHGDRLLRGSRSLLPEHFCQALDGLPLRADSGPCALAVLDRVPVRVDAIDRDFRWSSEYRSLAARFGIQGAWAQPILDASGTALGALVAHGGEGLALDPELPGILAMATHVAAIALESHREKRALEESGLRFRQLFDASPQPMAIADAQDRIVTVNGQFTRTFGYTVDQIPDIATWCVRACPSPEEGARVAELWARRRKAWREMPPSEVRVACAGGEVLTTLVSATAVGQELLVIWVDITERVRAELERTALQAEVQQSQKMESIGRLAGGVAHDFNNMLGVIVANAEIGLASPGTQAEARFEEIRKAALRSAELTRQLLAFARKQAVSPRVVNLNEAIPGMLQMLARLIGENIALDYTQRAGVWPIRMDPSQLDQILANLAVNARDAIDGVGTLAIHTENVEFLESDPVRHPHRRAGKFVLLQVRDTGCGMSEEQQAHIFEPFFTTKQIGKGTGLGLATVYGVVRQNGGFIEVESAPGQGTAFRVYLPRHEGEPDPQLPHPAEQVRSAPGGHERILVVEDEPMNLEVTATLLASLGYDVLTAATPSGAIRRLREDDGIDLLLTDVVMPEMNGRELADRAQAAHPGLKCLFMSGYQADLITRDGELEGDVRLVSKPFTMDELGARVREVLDA